MERIFNKIGTCVSSNGHSHKQYAVSWDLLLPIVKKWSRVSEPDVAYVDAMERHVRAGGYVSHYIHLAELAGEGLVCYDGNHRREVFARLGDGSERIVLVDVLLGATTKDVMTHFEAINKSAEAPKLTSAEDALDASQVLVAKEGIHALVRKYAKKYKSYMSVAAKCRAPQFNREAFAANLLAIWRAADQSLRDMAKFEQALEALNEAYANGQLCEPHDTYPEKVIEKCRSGGLWLFINREVSAEHFCAV